MSGSEGIEIKTIKRHFNPRGHGGRRPGAGRPRGSFKRPVCACGDERAAVLAEAVKAASPLKFALAALVLGANADAVRRSLGMSRAEILGLVSEAFQGPGGGSEVAPGDRAQTGPCLTHRIFPSEEK